MTIPQSKTPPKSGIDPEEGNNSKSPPKHSPKEKELEEIENKGSETQKGREMKVRILPPKKAINLDSARFRIKKSIPPKQGTTLQQNPPSKPGITLHWSLFSIPWLILFLYWSGSLLLNRRLIQQLSPYLPDFVALRVQNVEEHLFDAPDLRRAALKLRQHQNVGDGRLNTAATVNKTARNGGFFDPVFAIRPEFPEYLALVDRFSIQDHQAFLAELLIERMKQAGMEIELLSFSKNPTASVGNQVHGFKPLYTLTTAKPNHRVLVFGDGEGFIDPFSGKSRKELHPFGLWEARVLLSPKHPMDWGYVEGILNHDLLPILPQSLEGVSLLSQTMTGEGNGSDGNTHTLYNREEEQGPFPPLLKNNSNDWLDEKEPQAERIEELIEQLRVYLGASTFRWLCACAFFPGLYWGTTTYLGHTLRDELGTPLLRENRLLALSRLPWFRYGTMPEWLRMKCINITHRQERKVVVKALQNLLVNALEHPEQCLDLPIIDKTSFGSRQKLLAFLRQQPKESLFRDYLFLNLMSGRKPHRQVLRLPRGLRRLFRHPKFPSMWRALFFILLSSGAMAYTIDPVSLPQSLTTASHSNPQLATNPANDKKIPDPPNFPPGQKRPPGKKITTEEKPSAKEKVKPIKPLDPPNDPPPKHPPDVGSETGSASEDVIFENGKPQNQKISHQQNMEKIRSIGPRLKGKPTTTIILPPGTASPFPEPLTLDDVITSDESESISSLNSKLADSQAIYLFTLSFDLPSGIFLPREKVTVWYPPTPIVNFTKNSPHNVVFYLDNTFSKDVDFSIQGTWVSVTIPGNTKKLLILPGGDLLRSSKTTFKIFAGEHMSGQILVLR